MTKGPDGSGESVLGIDAAWTENQPSGVALLVLDAGTWDCRALAPGYVAFLELARGAPVVWTRRERGCRPDVVAVLDAARAIAGVTPAVVAVDMPIARSPISGRRPADTAISRAFGGAGCSVHSPSSKRPGRIADGLRRDFEREGIPLVTRAPAGATPALVEVYPHVALLRLMRAEYRLPYKVSRSRRFWPGATVPERVERLLGQWRAIASKLSERIDLSRFQVPEPKDVRTLASLKPFEDALDALVCAWVATEYLRGAARPYGDDDACIWVPGQPA